ncbi:hypothetical protein PG994_004418 [Apiospora phragmitis]|uniref:N-acetyltransferase domain-containing protein n=1 Tax=Apiospora phragmitis TaxID=2905665 RepID=A0ABR1VUE3_9PEZI
MAGDSSKNDGAAADVRIELMSSPDDLAAGYEALCGAFGHQTNDAIWTAMNPGWDTAQGKKEHVARLVERWQSTTTNRNGQPNEVFLKATVPDPEDDQKRVVAGMAIWCQLSFVAGLGDDPKDDPPPYLGELYPGDERTQRFCTQLIKSLVRRRIEYVRSLPEQPQQTTRPAATFTLDICAVDPRFQRRGVANRLVQWGLDEAERRGGLEATTEASAMGRHAYARLGFRPEEGRGDEVYDVDEEFRDRELPPNLFMRTGVVAAADSS